MNPPRRRKKRTHPAQRIVPRGRMGPQWIAASVALALLIVIAGLMLMLTR